MKLADKVAIVTGAGRGIGLAVATSMAEAGASVVLADLDDEALQASGTRLRDRGFQVAWLAGDVANQAHNHALAQFACEAFGKIDILHANAGIAPFEDLLETTPARMARTLEINLMGAMLGCAAVIPRMIERRRGVILLTASIAAFVGDPSIPVYSASKGGLTALCRSLAVRHGPEGIRCNTICPGDVRTMMLEDYLALAGDPEAARGEMISRYPLGRLAEPEDIGHLAVFLASDDASWITGADFVIDGGLTARCY
jgi:NAD(P)-dependent dehydrogenase (short-subunit alcohol dehydrogenase family)